MLHSISACLGAVDVSGVAQRANVPNLLVSGHLPFPSSFLQNRPVVTFHD
jgi:hypothetical protein